MDATPADCRPDLDRLKAVLDDIAPPSSDRRFALAYSGGLDSRFLAFAAKQLGFTPVLLHIIGPQFAPDETAQALKDAEKLGLEALCVPAGALSISALAQAGRKRCYVCKKALFTALIKTARENGEIAPNTVICDGTNFSDIGVFRPGLAAVQELGIRSPLAEARISKPRIRELGRVLGLPNPNQAARPCLLTRFPYGAVPSSERLRAVAAAEKTFTEIYGDGLRLRIRVLHDQDVRLHVEAASLSACARKRGISTDELLNRCRNLFKQAWPDKGAKLSVEVLEILSGYYDRTEAAPAAETAAVGRRQCRTIS